MKLTTLPFTDLLNVSDDIYKSTVITAMRAKQIVSKRVENKTFEKDELMVDEYIPSEYEEEREEYIEEDKAIVLAVHEFLDGKLHWKNKESETEIDSSHELL